MHESKGYQPAEVLLGDSPATRRLSQLIHKAALTDVPVLITGESGSGKEMAARLLHDLGVRRDHSFVKVNCPAIPTQQFESELFGHDPGAFPAAPDSTTGKFGQADHGTLFLDEIGELELALQAKLLHALDDFKVVRLGAMDERAVDVRLICASSRDLEAAVGQGGFRTDLFYRINVLRIEMPPLRERISDVPILMNHFIRLYSERFGGRPGPLSTSFLNTLASYHWPGNIRELENLAKRYVVLGDEDQIISTLREPSGIRLLAGDSLDLNTPLRVQTKRAVQRLERKIILGVLQAHKWNRRKAARSLDISYRALLYKIKEAGLPRVRTTKANQQETQYQGPDEMLG